MSHKSFCVHKLKDIILYSGFSCFKVLKHFPCHGSISHSSTPIGSKIYNVPFPIFNWWVRVLFILLIAIPRYLVKFPPNAFRKQLTSHSSPPIGVQMYNATCSFINWWIRVLLPFLIAFPYSYTIFLHNAFRKQLMSHSSAPLTPQPQPQHM